VYSINVVDEKACVKWNICEKYRAQGPRGIGNGCTTIQYDSMTTYSQSCINQTSVQKKMFETKRVTKPIQTYIMTINETNKKRLITTMTLTYFIV